MHRDETARPPRRASWIQRLTDSVVDGHLRRKYRRQLYDTPFDRYTVRIAHTVAEHQLAFRLLKAAYDVEGLTSPEDELRITAQHVLPESTVFVAFEGERAVGTLTVTLDSPAGLPLDRDYGHEINALRRDGNRLVEYGSLMVVRRCRHSGVATLLNMAAHWFSTRFLEATHCVAGVHPRIAPYYRAIYDFKTLGTRAAHAELLAEVLGMVQVYAEAEPEFGRRFPGPAQSGLPLLDHYTWALPPCIQMPPLDTLAALARWKLPREVFRSLFVEGSERVATLDPQTRDHLASWRTLRTVTTDSSTQRQRLHARRDQGPVHSALRP